MTSVGKPTGAEVVRPVIGKLRSLGLEGEAELQAFLKLIKVRGCLGRGEEIIDAGSSPSHSSVLLTGIACSYRRLQDGSRHIFTFHHPRDFCDLHRYVLPERNGAVAVAAITDGLVGTICHKDLDQTLVQHPKLGLALWRATMLEASIIREKLVNVSRRSALQRVVHLLCEQLARREAIGINCATIPLNQVDLADAAGLSVVHVNRTVQGLRMLGVLTPDRRSIEVTDKERLLQIANFDARYLSMPKVLSNWTIDSQ